ncbi:hypothetical protein JCM10212_006677 [Sporobolomyces blumeae]
MQALSSTARPIVFRGLRQTNPNAAVLASLRLASSRAYATQDDANAAMQKKQLRMAEKAGRMKQNLGAMTSIPIFANHVPPVEGRKLAPGSTIGLRFKYLWFDGQNVAYSWWTQRRWKKLLGTDWYKKFAERALITYQGTNQALATGNYDRIRPYVASVVIDSIKAQRASKLQGLRMSWKLHEVIEQKVVCAREQELFKKDEPVGQLAVRFVAKQSLEIRDARGRLVGSGSHDDPERITEYLIFQRDMWRPDDEWKCVKKGARETDTLANPADQP